MGFEKRGGHSKKDKVEAFLVLKFRCAICDAEFGSSRKNLTVCPDCGADKDSLIQMNINKED